MTRKKTVMRMKPRVTKIATGPAAPTGTRPRVSPMAKTLASLISTSKRGANMTTSINLTTKTCPSSRTPLVRLIGPTIQKVWPLDHAPKAMCSRFATRPYRHSKRWTRRLRFKSRSTRRLFRGYRKVLRARKATRRSLSQTCLRSDGYAWMIIATTSCKAKNGLAVNLKALTESRKSGGFRAAKHLAPTLKTGQLSSIPVVITVRLTPATLATVPRCR